jgi:hypothetical protein
LAGRDADTTDTPSRPVARRRVFYIPGYDPFPPRRYRELYRSESAAQAAISGYHIALGPAGKSAHFGWQVRAGIEGATTRTDFEVLVWSDLVRDSMSNTIPATYAQLLRTAWAYIGSGALWRLMRLRKGPVIAALYPIGMLLLQLAVALALAYGVAAGLLWGGGLVLPEGAQWLAALIATLVASGALIAVLRWFRARDGRFFAYYLMHDYAHSARLNGAYPADLEARLAQFADRIAEALTEDLGEVLVVGHSSGAHLGVSVLTDLIRSGRAGEHTPALGFLTLGQVVPMLSFLPEAHRLRGDLQFLSRRKELTWVDITAPGDGCSFALCDPVSVSGVSPPDKIWPLVFSAAFTQTLSPARWKTLRWRFFRLHFQYLCAFDRPRDYDYFRVTAGPLTLAERYRGRPASRSRIERAVSKYRTVSAP